MPTNPPQALSPPSSTTRAGPRRCLYCGGRGGPWRSGAPGLPWAHPSCATAAANLQVVILAAARRLLRLSADDVRIDHDRARGLWTLMARGASWGSQVLGPISSDPTLATLLTTLEAYATPYQTCRVCGVHLPDDLTRRALGHHQAECCSSDCRAAALLAHFACCSKATPHGCVCYYATECPDHGIRHHGTHD